MVLFVIIVGMAVIGLTALPLGIGIGAIGLFILHYLADGASSLAITSVWNVLTNFLLSAVPLFMFMGEILLRSGLSRRIYAAIAPLFNRIPGKLLHTNVVVCTLFGAVCGASSSTAAAVGSVAYPELKKRGYDQPIVLATLAAGGTLGLLIPPSLSLLIYGATQGVSIGRLFLGGVIPGIVLALLFMCWIWIQARRRPETSPGDESERRSLGETLLGLLSIWPLLVLAFVILGTIYLGIATATEAAALGVVATIGIGFYLRELSIKDLFNAFVSGTLIWATLATVIVGAVMLAQSISILAIPGALVLYIRDAGLTPYVVLFLLVIVYLVLGCFFDGLSMMLMTLPVVFPLITSLGFDQVWFGVILTILIEVGLLTPPVGLNLFVLMAISKNSVPIHVLGLACVPYWVIMLGSVALFTVFPSLVLWLPSMMN